MPISPDEAAEVAKRHGLSLADAAGLVSLAADTADADRIAARFAATGTAGDQAVRDYARRLFGRTDDEPPQPPEPLPANNVPAEGANPSTDKGDQDVRRFVARIFDSPNQDHI